MQQRGTRDSDHHNETSYDAVWNTAECYACTQVGVPVFHSTSCEGNTSHQPNWQASAGSSLRHISARSAPPLTSAHSGQFGSVLDPRSEQVQWWNRMFILTRGISLAVDPLFFYALTLSIGKSGAPCLHVDNGVAAIVTVARTCLDGLHLMDLWMQFRLAYVSKESLVIGCGKLVWDARVIVSHYLKSLKGFWFDVFLILPLPQTIFWIFVPNLIGEEKIKLVLMVIVITFLFQFLPKLYHSFHLMSRMTKVTGYIFGTIWWGFGLNIIAYLIASHVIGGCWYVLATRSVVSCLKEECERNGKCKQLSLWCTKGVCYQFMYPEDKFGNPCGNTTKMIAKPLCLNSDGPFNHGIYTEGLLVVTSNSLAVRILYPIYWGLLNLSSFGNELNPTCDLIEVVFSIFIVLCGLTLFTLMVGNIQVFMAVILAKNKEMQIKGRDIEWWMRRRQLPSDLRRRVRHFNRQRWEVMGGEDEIKWIEELPQGLRRDINRYLCLDLINKVPLFHNLDDLILDNICDRVKPLIFSKGEKIIREGDPVPRMYFIVRGRLKRTQKLTKGMLASSTVEAGGFLGDELLSWCLRRPFRVGQLPVSSATFYCVESAEAFGLDACHLRYITDHYRYTFASEKLKRTLRYYSSNWRTWGAVNIQIGWRRYKMRSGGGVVNGNSIHNLLRQYAVVFMSIRPLE